MATGDYLVRTAAGTLYRDSWPSLFIAPSGLRSELHVDAFGSNFWMAIFEGAKKYKSFAPMFTIVILFTGITTSINITMALMYQCCVVFPKKSRKWTSPYYSTRK